MISEAIRKETEEKIALHDATKEKIKARIEDKIRVAVERLESIKTELLGEVDEEFRKNPFAEFLNHDNSLTDADMRRLLDEQNIPENFGPNEKSFSTLFKDIDTLRAWRSFIPQNLKVKGTTWDSITLTWDEVADASFYQVEVDGNNTCDTSATNAFTKRGLLPDTEHSFRVRAVGRGSVSEWSDVAKGKTLKAPEFSECAWERCPGNLDKNKKYSVGKKNHRIVTKINEGGFGKYSTIIGSTHIPLNKMVPWNIKVLKSRDNDGDDIYIGVAPSDVNQNAIDNHKKCGWYFRCYYSELMSGPPHNYGDKKYGPRNGWGGRYVHTGDSVGVVMDTTKGELSFVLNGVNYGVAYKGIPLDIPLVPCVILYWGGDSVELDLSEVKENVDNSIPAPSNIVAKSTTCDSTILTWGKVKRASFYQIEVNGSILRDISTENSFTKRGLLPDTEHSFRVRTVGRSSVSEWSGVVKERTPKWECAWKECPGYVDDSKKYSVDNDNPKITTKINGGAYSTIIGNTPIPLSTVTSWSIKVLESWNNNGGGIFVGIAPFDINQNANNYKKCGWYFNCCWSELWSGPPHKHRDKEYGPRKECGQYVQTGDSVGVVVDTTRGNLSFVLNGVNCGVAYRGIPLDKPLVPCVLLENEGDSVELDVSEIKENVDSSVPVPSNITTKSNALDSITLTWDNVPNVSFYQIEVDGSKSWDATTTNTFIKRGLLPETEHSFRVRTVRGSSVSEWSGVVKGKTLKALEFSKCVWKKCPGAVDDDRKYSVKRKNPRVVTKVNYDDYGTIIGNTHIPLNTVTSWSVKILKSKDNNGLGIYIGVAPFDINQNNYDNYNKCGWYFHCYDSTLFSGPSHNYYYKEYGPRKDGEDYVHTGDSVGVVMDTTRGKLSFVLSNVNHGVAYSGISLDKPLVPCVLLKYQGDSVELIKDQKAAI